MRRSPTTHTSAASTCGFLTETPNGEVCTSRCARGTGLPGVIFDAVLSLNPNGTGTYRGAATPAGAVTVAGNTISAVLPIAFLAPPPPPAGAIGPLLPVELWTYNLWPRSNIRSDGTPLPFSNAQIADFAPDATTFPATVPEPSTMLLLASSLVGAAVRGVRRRRV